jgi:hypothetical protein
MRKRASLKKADWSIKREEQYRKNCEDILYKNGKEIFIAGTEVYLVSQGIKTFFISIDKPRSMWYEVWLKLRDLTPS